MGEKGFGKSANLIPYTSETAKINGRKGGLANKNNPNQRLAAKLRALKRKGLTDENSKHLLEVMTEHDMSALDVRIFLDSIRKGATSIRDKIQLGKSLVDWHKMHHGTTVNVNQKNLNINVDIDVEKVKEHLDKLFGGQENE